MRHPGSCVSAGVAGLGALVFTLGCVPPDVVHHGATPDAAAASAREEISRQIARRVDATRRKDVDALVGDAAMSWRDADGAVMDRATMRDVARRELASVERTIDLTVTIDSLRLAGDDSAMVYTHQRWERILVAADGSRHSVVTTAWLEQPWTRRAEGWRGAPGARQLRAGPTLVDGREVALVSAP